MLSRALRRHASSLAMHRAPATLARWSAPPPRARRSVAPLGCASVSRVGSPRPVGPSPRRARVPERRRPLARPRADSGDSGLLLAAAPRSSRASPLRGVLGLPPRSPRLRIRRVVVTRLRLGARRVRLGRRGRARDRPRPLRRRRRLRRGHRLPHREGGGERQAPHAPPRGGDGGGSRVTPPPPGPGGAPRGGRRGVRLLRADGVRAGVQLRPVARRPRERGAGGEDRQAAGVEVGARPRAQGRQGRQGRQPRHGRGDVPGARPGRSGGRKTTGGPRRSSSPRTATSRKPRAGRGTGSGTTGSAPLLPRRRRRRVERGRRM